MDAKHVAPAVEKVDVALSFAGEQRDYVSLVAEHLRGSGVNVFYDDFEQTNLWGRDLAVHFDHVYGEGAQYVVPFVSQAYAERAWPQHEFKTALARAVEKKEDRFILPVRFDSTKLPGLRSTIGYLDATRLKPTEIAEKILEVLADGKPKAEGTTAAIPKQSRVPRVPPTGFNPYAEAENAVAHLRRELTRRAKALEDRGYGVHAQDRDGRFGLRIMRSGRTVYRLDAWIGGGIAENAIHFSTGSGENVSLGSWNAYGTMEWDRSRDLPVVKLFNVSLLPDMGDRLLTPEELADAIWDGLCDQLERMSGD